LQKIDLLSAARCNLFSYSLAAYQANWLTLSEKNLEVLDEHIQIINKEPKIYNGSLKIFGAQENDNDKKNQNEKEGSSKDLHCKEEDSDQKLFFSEDFIDDNEKKIDAAQQENQQNLSCEKLIDDDGFDEFMSASNALMPSQLLMDSSLLNMPTTNVGLLSSLVPLSQDSTAASNSGKKPEEISLQKNPSKKANDVSKWFELFSDLDPLNQQKEGENSA
jgi:hypothetical protein